MEYAPSAHVLQLAEALYFADAELADASLSATPFASLPEESRAAYIRKADRVSEHLPVPAERDLEVAREFIGMGGYQGDAPPAMMLMGEANLGCDSWLWIDRLHPSREGYSYNSKIHTPPVLYLRADAPPVVRSIPAPEFLADFPLATAARSIACAYHGGQLYRQGHGRKGRPYVTHLDEVVAVLYRFGVRDDRVLAAGYLHDVLEDTALGDDPSILLLLFDAFVLGLVQAVTDEPGDTREEKKARTYPKIRADAQAVQLKLGDRIANGEASLSFPSKLQMYRSEHPGFREALYRPGEYDAMWAHLDALLS